ncbi:MAG: SPOR domain-containing protein [Candidatus Kapabacteria bacterium]|nr:SPOR domain-containing protein [Candidatus Kapabacteria bacterium]
MKKIILIMSLLFPVLAFAESAEISNYLTMIANGQVQEVKAKLPDMMVENPNDPGVLLVLGVVLEDGFKAIDIYHKIVREYPDSEWADDAYWRIIQFYSLLGDTSKAREFLNDFKLRYSSSTYVGNATEIVRMAVGLAKSDKKWNNSNSKSEKVHNESESKNEEKVVVKKEAKKETPAKPKAKAKEETITAKNIEEIKKPTESSKHVEEKVEAEEKQEKSDVAESKEMIEQKTKELPEELGKTGVYGLQVGVYKNKESAENEIKRFLKQRMRSELKLKQTKDGEMYAVVIGNYTSKESAEAAKAIVKQQCGCDPIIYEK